MRDRILDAASELFSRKGYHKACMDEIAAAAGVAKGSLYYHFQNKSQLFRDVAVRGMDILHREFIQAAASDMPPEEKVAAVLDRISELCFDYSGLFGIIMSEMPEGIEPEAWSSMAEARDRLIEYISGYLRNACENQGIVRPMDFGIVSNALLRFILAYRCQYREQNGRERMMREIRDVVMHGIMA